ncbi:MAG: hypothetical protein KatS3mg111_3861 [Pirellulaceae bacterium]|nr:MAG: hypothetical protein KatS3mg111_3861 [Pirellulaceae bacterium]
MLLGEMGWDYQSLRDASFQRLANWSALFDPFLVPKLRLGTQCLAGSACTSPDSATPRRHATDWEKLRAPTPRP